MLTGSISEDSKVSSLKRGVKAAGNSGPSPCLSSSKSDEPPASRKPLRRQGKASPCVYWLAVSSVFERMWSKSPSSQRRASRNARLCQSVFRCTPYRQPQTRRAESLRCTPLPVYVGPRRSGQSLPPVPSAQVSAESTEPFGLVILAGSNLLRLHFRQRLPSAGPTLTWEGQKFGA